VVVLHKRTVPATDEWFNQWEGKKEEGRESMSKVREGWALCLWYHTSGLRIVGIAQPIRRDGMKKHKDTTVGVMIW